MFKKMFKKNFFFLVASDHCATVDAVNIPLIYRCVPCKMVFDAGKAFFLDLKWSSRPKARVCPGIKWTKRTSFMGRFWYILRTQILQVVVLMQPAKVASAYCT